MVKMIYSPVGIVIGERVVSEEGILALKNPRIMQIGKPDESGKSQINITAMLGNPKGFEIERGVMNYDVTDENILKAYTESTSGLTLVERPSLVDAGGKAL